MKKTLIALTVLAALSANAAGEHNHEHKHDDSEHIHLGAHEHGVANLNLVVEGDEVKVILETPAMNVMGFEYEPTTEADLENSHKALHHLQDGEWLVINGGECKFHEGEVEWKYAEQVHEHFHGKDGEHKDEEHKHDHAEHDHKEGETHSDVDAKLDFDCEAPDAVKSVTVELFEAYAGFEKINVQWIVGDKQGATTLTKASHDIKFDK